MKKSKKSFLVLFSIFIIYNIIEYVFRTSLFLFSNEITKIVQSSIENPIIEKLIYLFSELLHPALLGFIMLCIYFCRLIEKIRTLNFFIFFFISIYISQILKMLNSEPRPYWEDKDIIPKQQYSEYGNPSGHVMLACVFYFGIYEIFIVQIELDMILTKKKFSKFSKNCFVIFIFLIICMIGFSRLYLGMHSLNQIINGLVWGMFLIYLYLFQEGKNNIDYYLSECLFQKNKKNFMRFTYICIICLFFSIICYLICFYTYTIHDQWIERIKYVDKEFKIEDGFYSQCFKNSSCIGTIFGIVLGVFLTRIEKFDPELLNKIDKVKILRNIFLKFIATFIFYIYVGISTYLIKRTLREYVILKFLLVDIPIQTIFGLCFSKFLKIIFKKINIHSIEDEIYYKMNMEFKGDLLDIENI